MMDERTISEILKTEQTPLYVFDIGELKRRVRQLRTCLPKRAEICYAVKANPFILETLGEMADWLEICSPGELRICRALGLAEKKFVISGVYKEADVMAHLMSGEGRPGYYTVESETQFAMLRETAGLFERKIPVLLRLTSGNQFGLDEDVLANIVGQYQSDRWVDIRGLQYFSGTQKTSLKKLAREIKMLDDYLARLWQLHHFKMPKLEYGPGFPVAYFEGDSFEETDFLRGFSDLLSQMRYDGPITLEIGRSLAAGCGTYLTRVVDRKRNHGANYAIVDGGMHQIAYYGQSMAMKRPRFSLFPPRPEGQVQEWNICGSLCTASDFLVKQIPVSNLATGDILVFENAGAYCMTEGISLFLSRDLPEIVLLNEDGTYAAVRKHTTVDGFHTPKQEIKER